jgi:hypothetical protein
MYKSSVEWNPCEEYSPYAAPLVPECSTWRWGGGEGWRGLCCSGWFGPESDMEFTVKPKQEVGRGGDGPETGAGGE